MSAWTFSRLWRVPDPTLFQITLVAALLATVLGDCGPPPYLSFALPINELNQTNFKPGTSLKYTCRPGYIRTTSSRYPTVNCKIGGTWQYSVFCTKRHCSNPGELRNGQVIINTDYSFGSYIKFDCSEGYVLVGPTTSYCEIQDRAVGWSNTFPECVIAQCKPPPDISNGKHNAGNEDVYTYGSSVTYSCDPGFSMLGKASISCTVENKTDSIWSPSPPTCKKIACPQPDVTYGKIAYGFRSTHKYKDSITFECNKGFILKGNSVIHCEADNNWNPPPPTCELNSCTDLPDIPHASWEAYHYRKPTKGEVYEVGTVLKYRCHPGYKPAGDKPMTVTCQKDFMWTSYAECVEVCCPVPELKNGRIIKRRKHLTNNCDYFYGDSISYTCHGRYLYDNSEATCQGDGTWSPGTPTCDETLCQKPEIEHGKLLVDKDQFVESENVTIQCDSGYGVVGSQNITCLGNSGWNPEVPKCEWEIPQGCEQVLAGRRLMQCLPRLEDVKMALEMYKLSLEIELLELQRDKEKKFALEESL
ncbi:C4b-binding protein alpha chain isoform 2-T2 [Rhynchonycteris naso]